MARKVVSTEESPVAVAQQEVSEFHNSEPQSNELFSKFRESIEEIKKDIQYHEQESEKHSRLAQEKKDEMSSQLAELLSFVGESSPENKRKSSASSKNKTVKDLIVEYLEKHGEAKAADVKTWLEKFGRTSHPNIELSKMVADGTIERVERGLYQLKK